MPRRARLECSHQKTPRLAEEWSDCGWDSIHLETRSILSTRWQWTVGVSTTITKAKCLPHVQRFLVGFDEMQWFCWVTNSGRDFQGGFVRSAACRFPGVLGLAAPKSRGLSGKPLWFSSARHYALVDSRAGLASRNTAQCARATRKDGAEKPKVSSATLKARHGHGFLEARGITDNTSWKSCAKKPV